MKLKILDYKLLLKLVLPLMALLVVASYYLAFQKTVMVYQNYALLKAQDGGSESLSVSPMYTMARIKQVDELYDRFKVDTLSWKNSLWNHGAGLSQKYGVSINAFPPVKAMILQDLPCFQQRIGFNGDFASLLKLTKELSLLKYTGMIAGVKYAKKNRDAQVSLTVDLLALPKQTLK